MYNYKKRTGKITDHQYPRGNFSELFHTEEEGAADINQSPYHTIDDMQRKWYSENYSALKNDKDDYIDIGEEISYFREDKKRMLYLDCFHPLISYCEDQFKNTPCNRNCNSDKDTFTDGKLYEDQLDEVIEDCKKRLDLIQKKNEDEGKDEDKNVNRNYNCERLMYDYTLRYAPVYCSEMIEALAQAEKMAQEEHKSNPNMELLHRDNRVLSLGCGNAVDLLSFDWFRTADIVNIGKHPFHLEYCGIDKSDKWTDIQNYVRENCNVHPSQVRFITGLKADLLSCFDNDNDLIPVDDYNFNVIILPYVNSLIYKLLQGNDDKMREWYDKLIEKVIDPKKSGPIWVVINDTEAERTYDLFTEEIEGYGYKTHSRKFYFPHKIGSSYFIPCNDTFTEYTENNVEFCKRNENLEKEFVGVFDETKTKGRKDTDKYLKHCKWFSKHYKCMENLQATQLIVEVEEA